METLWPSERSGYFEHGDIERMGTLRAYVKAERGEDGSVSPSTSTFPDESTAMKHAECC